MPYMGSLYLARFISNTHAQWPGPWRSSTLVSVYSSQSTTKRIQNATAQQLQSISHYNPRNAFLLQAYSTVTSPQEPFCTRHCVIMIHVVFFDIIIAMMRLQEATWYKFEAPLWLVTVNWIHPSLGWSNYNLHNRSTCYYTCNAVQQWRRQRSSWFGFGRSTFWQSYGY